MKRALRSSDTQLFFKSDGHQTNNIDEAQPFQGFGDAVEFCRQHKLRHTELIFRTGRPEDDLRVKIDDDGGSGQVVKWWVGQTPKGDLIKPTGESAGPEVGRSDSGLFVL
jgi:hypothetical protein